MKLKIVFTTPSLTIFTINIYFFLSGIHKTLKDFISITQQNPIDISIKCSTKRITYTFKILSIIFSLVFFWGGIVQIRWNEGRFN